MFDVQNNSESLRCGLILALPLVYILYELFSG
jgi:hypothetical protein